ncbi:MAG: sulfatase [Planctomycetota bacterium]
MRFAVAVALACILAAVPSCGARDRPAPKHVLLLVIDTQRADHLSCYGHPRPTSPTLDALAAEGVRFENCVSQSSWTSPSMVSLMTSCYLGNELLEIPRDRTVVAEVYRKAGYATGAFICNDILSPTNGFDRGFDVCEWQMTPYGSNQPIFDWLERNKDRRTFTFVHLNEVHDDAGTYGPKPLEDGRFRKGMPAFTEARSGFYDRVSDELKLTAKEESLTRMRGEIGGYDDDVLYSDRRIGEIFERYKSLGLWGDTAVVVGADHGEGLFTRVQFMHGTRKKAMEEGKPPTLLNTLHMTHGSHVNWELVHVPLIVKAPGFAPGVVSGYVENVDIVPTLLELSALAAPRETQGRSLVPFLDDPRRTKGLAEAVTSLTRFNLSMITQDGMQLIHPTPRGECDFSIQDELYDLKVDRESRVNLAASHKELVRRLGTLAEERARSGIHGTTHPTDAKTHETLAGLGYVGADVVDSISEELAAKSTAEIVAEIPKEANCLLRLQMVRALEGRTLAAEDRAALEAFLPREISVAVQEGVRRLLAP